MFYSTLVSSFPILSRRGEGVAYIYYGKRKALVSFAYDGDQSVTHA